jgi:hypothetical protein
VFIGTLTGFLASDDVTATYTRTPGMTAGSPYTISATLSPAGVLGNYNITYNTAVFTIGRAAPVITWPAPASMTIGSALGPGQLDATANVSGTFVYTPPSGAVLLLGNQPVSVVFTPTDAVDYNTSAASTSISVVVVTSTCVETLSAKVKVATPGIPGDIQFYWTNTWTSAAPVDHYNVYRSLSTKFSTEAQLAGTNSPLHTPAVTALQRPAGRYHSSTQVCWPGRLITIESPQPRPQTWRPVSLNQGEGTIPRGR